MEPIRVLIADDYPSVRLGLSTYLRDIEGIEVAGEAADGREAVRRIGECKPHVVLTDIFIRGLDGFEVAARVRREWPGVRVTMFTGFSTRHYVLQALGVGVAGYIVKVAPFKEVDLAIRVIAQGGTYFSAQVGEVVSDYFRSQGAGADPLEKLTPQKREILRLLAQGSDVKQIAGQLGLCRKTVEAHRACIMEILGVRDFASLVRFAVQVGLVPPYL